MTRTITLGCLALLATVLLVVSGCSNSNTMPTTTGARGGLSFTMLWPAHDASGRFIPDSTAQITIAVLRNGTQLSSTTLTRQPGQDTATARLQDIPEGAVIVTVRALDGNGQLIALSGDVDATVVPNRITPLDILLVPPFTGKLATWSFYGYEQGVFDCATGEYGATNIGTSNEVVLMPDGQHFLTPNASMNALQIVKLDGTVVSQVVADPNLMIWRANCSRDGSLIVIPAFETGNPGGTSCNIFVVNTDGSNMRKLTNFTSESGAQLFWATISPDNQYVTFMNYDANGPSVWRVNVDGTNLQQLATNAAYPVIAPDGSKIAYLAMDGYNTTSKFYTMNPDGSGATLLADAGMSTAYPASYSPDGQWLAFSGSNTNWSECDLYAMKLDGSVTIRLTHTPGIFCQSWVAGTTSGLHLNIH